MDEASPESSSNSQARDLREHMRPDVALDQAIIARWRDASPSEHGRVLWGLLEFADMVQRSKGELPEPEPLASLPKPFAERRTGGEA